MRGVEAEKVIEWVDRHLAVILTSTQKDLIRLYVGGNASRPGSGNAYRHGGRRFAELLVAEYCEEADRLAGQKNSLGIRTMVHCVLCASGEHTAQAHELGPEFVRRPSGCRCHSRLGLTMLQHENDCPLARPARQDFSDCRVGQIVSQPFENEHSWTCDMGDGTYLVAHREKHIQGQRPDEPIYDEAARIPDRVFMDSDSEKLSVTKAVKSILAQDSSDIMGSNWAKALSKQVHEACTTLELLHGHGPAKVVWETDLTLYASRAKVTMPFDADCTVCAKAQQGSKLQEDSDG